MTQSGRLLSRVGQRGLARSVRVRRVAGRLTLACVSGLDGREIGKTSRTYAAHISQKALA